LKFEFSYTHMHKFGCTAELFLVNLCASSFFFIRFLSVKFFSKVLMKHTFDEHSKESVMNIFNIEYPLMSRYYFDYTLIFLCHINRTLIEVEIHI